LAPITHGLVYVPAAWGTKTKCPTKMTRALLPQSAKLNTSLKIAHSGVKLRPTNPLLLANGMAYFPVAWGQREKNY